MPSIKLGAVFKSTDLQGYTGKGINVLLVEEGTPNIPILHCNKSFSTNQASSLVGHANKIAGLLCSSDYGLAPEISLFCINHSVIIENKFYSVVKEIVKLYGEIAVSVHAYSGLPTPSLYNTESSFKHCQQDKSTAHLMVAAAGHNGCGLVRYPACLPYTFAVGVCEADTMCHFSGYNKEIGKPEILVPNYDFATYKEVGISATVNGTSAGVAVVAGLAALWAEKLKKQGIIVTWQILKASLLATSKSSRYPNIGILKTKGTSVMTNVLIKNNAVNNTNNTTKDKLTILGLSASHDASACIIQNSTLQSAIQLERITRKKRDGVGYLNSDLAANYCLESLKIAAKEVDYFAYNSQPLIPDYVGLSMPTHDSQFTLFDPFASNAFFVSHHLAHAYSAFFCSPFEEAVVLVADGSGGSVYQGDDLILPGNELQAYLNQKLLNRPPVHVLSCYLFSKDKVELLHREYADSFNVRCGSKSLGETYAAVSQYIFGSWHDSGKLMGLAPYGDHLEYGESLLQEDQNRLLHFSHEWKNYHRENSQRDAMKNRNLAARIQADFETALLQRINLIRQKTKLKNLAYAGGLALNSVANEKIIGTGLFDNVYFFPASSDAGISVGAGAALNHHLTKQLKRSPVKHMFLGHPYQKKDYHYAIQKYWQYVNVKEVTTKEIANNLSNGEIFGLFQKGSEFGPRALGHRSIIADPRYKAVWQFINKRIKFREDFRPFAPAVIKEAADQFFNVVGESPYMLRIVTVKTEYKDALQAITHVNGTARLQTVDDDCNPYFYELLKQFGEVSGLPILVNTSFNMAGHPIVEKPEEALEMLLCSHLDGVLFEDVLVRPNRISNITTDTKILLAPDLKLCSENSANACKYFLTSNYRGKKQIMLTLRQFKILEGIASQTPISEFFLSEEELQWLNSLSIMNLLFQLSEVQQNEIV